MKIELLKTFLEVSRTLHFRIASETLFITQSAVSARIKLLEDELGVLLFDRSQKNLKLTAEGNKLIKHANELIFMWQKTKQDVGVGNSNATQLVIGSMMTIWDIILQQWLHSIDKNLEEISLFTNTYTPQELIKNTLNSIVDVAFLFEPPFIEEIISEKIATVPLHLVSTDANIVNVDAAEVANYVMVDYGESVNTQYLRDFQYAQSAKHYMSQPRIALNFLLARGGSAYLPKQMTAPYVKKGQLYIVEKAPVYSREIYAIYLARSQKRELIEKSLTLFPAIDKFI